MLSKSKQKLIASLARKKIRDQEKLFVAEGHKLVSDLLSTSLKCQLLIANEEWLRNNSNDLVANEIVRANPEELKKISNQKSPPHVIGIFKQLEHELNFSSFTHHLSLFLDDVQDPGNLGTIIRIADWFGIENIICTRGCADVYNTKTVQSTMGAIARVKVHYQDAKTFFEKIDKVKTPIYGTFLEGRNIYKSNKTTHGIIVMGNEGKGISKEVAQHISSKLFIPNYPNNVETSESLNVSVATAIICAEFRRP